MQHGEQRGQRCCALQHGAWWASSTRTVDDVHVWAAWLPMVMLHMNAATLVTVPAAMEGDARTYTVTTAPRTGSLFPQQHSQRVDDRRVEARVRCVMMLQAATVNATVGLMVGFTGDGELTPLVVEVMDEDEGYSSPACERLQPTGLRVSDGSWHYVALTYGDTTATVDSAEAAAVTLPAKLLGDLMFVSLHAGHFHSALDELRVWDSAYTAARWRRWRAPRRYRPTLCCPSQTRSRLRRGGERGGLILTVADSRTWGLIRTRRHRVRQGVEDGALSVWQAGAHDVKGAAYAAFTYATYDGILSNPDTFSGGGSRSCATTSWTSPGTWR